jgi:hypothetical protein
VGIEFVDITGNPIKILLSWPDKDTQIVSDHPIPSFLLSAPVQTLLTIPLNQMLDQFWSGTRDSNGKTQRDKACDNATREVANAVRGIGSEYSAWLHVDCLRYVFA